MKRKVDTSTAATRAAQKEGERSRSEARMIRGAVLRSNPGLNDDVNPFRDIKRGELVTPQGESPILTRLGSALLKLVVRVVRRRSDAIQGRACQNARNA